MPGCVKIGTLEFVEKAFAYLDNLNTSNYLVGYSGGIDSTVLLYICNEYRKVRANVVLRALYVNHGNAFGQQQFDYQSHCQRWCYQKSIDFLAVSIAIHKKLGQSLEATARKQRYQVFADVLGNHETLLLGHHLNDHVETFLLRLNRSAGIRGLQAIPQQRPFAKGMIARPLLYQEKKTLVRFAKLHNIEWLEDCSNADIRHDRNYIRRNVIPTIESRWDNFRSRWCRSIALLQEQWGSLAWFCERELISLQAKDSLPCASLRQYPVDIQKQLIILWCTQQNLVAPRASVLDDIIKQMLVGNSPSARICLSQYNSNGEIDKVELACYRERLYLVYDSLKVDCDAVYNWNPKQPLQLVHGILTTETVASGGVTLPQAELNVRFRQGGEMIQPSYKHCRTTLKKLYQEQKIPPWLRQQLPLIYRENQLIAVADICIAKQVQQATGQGVRFIWRPQSTKKVSRG